MAMAATRVAAEMAMATRPVAKPRMATDGHDVPHAVRVAHRRRQTGTHPAPNCPAPCADLGREVHVRVQRWPEVIEAADQLAALVEQAMRRREAH
jgi:hypothetical protein